MDMRRLALLTAAFALALASTASAAPLLPPNGKVFTGVSGSRSVKNFQRQVGKHPSVFGFFHKWGASSAYVYNAMQHSGSRLMLHISTQDGYGTKEIVTPRGISRGLGDAYLVRTNREIAGWGQPTYVRFLAEMNQTNNGYCAYNRNGTSRGPAHSTKAFIAAWRRATLILRGGPVAAINTKLAKLHLPAVKTNAVELPSPQVAMAWVPQTAGSPNIHANRARAYWPGSQYVDWIGTDFYSRFPNFRDLNSFYADFPNKPFVFGEWAMWGSDNAAFVHQFFKWVNTHKRVRMLLYNQGNMDGGPFRLTHFPKSRAAIRGELKKARFLP